MFCRQKVRWALLLLGCLLLVGLAQLYRRLLPDDASFSLAWFQAPCRIPDAQVLANFRRLHTRCSAWPRQNVYFVSQGLLKRNRHLRSADLRCYLLALDGLTARLLGDEDVPIREPLLRIDCHDSAGSNERPHQLLLPAVPMPGLGAARPPRRLFEEQWNVLVLGVGGLSRRLWADAMPQSMELFVKEMRGAVITQLAPMGYSAGRNLEELLRHRATGPWITEVFREQGYSTLAGVLTHVNTNTNLPQPPAMFNLSAYYAARKALSSPGCVGLVAEGSIMLLWMRELMLLRASKYRVFSFLHLADLVFPSMQRLDAELVSFLLEYLHFEAYSKTALILYSLPDHRSGFEPGLLVFHPPPRLTASSEFRLDMLRSSFAVGDFFTPADLNRVLAFLASDQMPSLLADIGRDARSCRNLRIASPVCRCIPG